MDRDTAVAYYMCVRHGILPHVVCEMSEREKALIYAMSRKEYNDSKKG